MTIQDKIIYLKAKYIKEKGTTPNTLLINEYNFKEYLKEIGHQYSDYNLKGCMVNGLFVIFSEQFSIAITITKDIIYIDETELTKENIIQEVEKANEEIGNAERFVAEPCHCEDSDSERSEEDEDVAISINPSDIIADAHLYKVTDGFNMPGQIKYFIAKNGIGALKAWVGSNNIDSQPLYDKITIELVQMNFLENHMILQTNFNEDND